MLASLDVWFATWMMRWYGFVSQLKLQEVQLGQNKSLAFIVVEIRFAGRQLVLSTSIDQSAS